MNSFSHSEKNAVGLPDMAEFLSGVEVCGILFGTATKLQ